MVVGQDRNAESESNLLRDLAECAEHHLGAGRSGESREEVVLDHPQVVIAKTIGKGALFERLLVERVPVDTRAFILSLHFVEKPKLHAASPLTTGPPEKVH